MSFCLGKSSPVRGLLSAQTLQLFRVTLMLCAFALPAMAASESTVILAEASKAFSGGKAITSVEMTGRATWTAGSDKQEGSARLVAKSSGESSSQFDLTNGTRTEKQSAIGVDRVCSWSGKDGVEHESSAPNCWTATVWFLPHLALQAENTSNLNVQGAMVTDKKSVTSPHIRHQILFPVEAQHLAAKQLAAVRKQIDQVQAWSTTDLTLDSSTALPSSLKYTVHPDDNSFVDIAVEVRYSSYKAFSGVQIPMHIERYVNGSLQLTLDIDSASVN